MLYTETNDCDNILYTLRQWCKVLTKSNANTMPNISSIILLILIILPI